MSLNAAFFIPDPNCQVLVFGPSGVDQSRVSALFLLLTSPVNLLPMSPAHTSSIVTRLMDYVDSIDFCEGFFTSLIKGSSLQPVYRHILLIYLFLLLLPHGRLMGQSVQFPIDFMEAERNEAIPGHVSHQDVID